MLYPQMNAQRMLTELNGFWHFAADQDNKGEEKGWPYGIPREREVAVSASWNEQFQDLMYFFETGWYETTLEVPSHFRSELLWLRIGAANYLTKIWINGQYVGSHEGAHLPFEFEVSSYMKCGQKNTMIISVDAQIKSDRLPPGDVEEEQVIGFKGQYPNNYYDFFPYGGINRPVYLYTTAPTYIKDITVNTEIQGETAVLSYDCQINQPFQGTAVITLDEEAATSQVTVDNHKRVTGQLTIPSPRLWGMEDPYLYELCIQLFDDEICLDSYTLEVGIREIELMDHQLYLNGQPVFLNGFGLHEDFPVLGKGLNHAVIAKDMNLLKWTGANSFRTSHYPYSEEFLRQADRQGMLVIGETPFVGFVQSHYQNDKIQEQAKKVIGEMINRDKNHPSIIAWSLANEGDTFVPEASAFYHSLYQCAKSLDPSRLVTIVNCVDIEEDHALQHFDFISLNRYYGWYEQAGRLDEGCEMLSKKLDRCFEVFQKPIIVTEFGADAIAGLHTNPPEQFTEEYQAEMVTRQYQIIADKTYTIGAHIWSFADFKTSQTPSRVVVNRKGLFARDRQPKLAAHRIKELWGE
ncbi:MULTISPECIES: beta-glucuronidase [Gracilibacillus]|uniref:beta-glucuronidase n=1 Tax=Gracilibacillus TaxID=74385 RepID=UPI000826D4D3|nr:MULTISPECIES: beta-glucuronidase [Gracilibacillus]